MKKMIFACLAVFYSAANFSQIDPSRPDPNPPHQIPGYRLVWSDEFNYTGKPASENWSFETGFVRNNEHQWYQSDNANVRNGALEIQGRRQTFRNPNFVSGSSDWKTNREYVNFTSSSIHSRGKQSFRYGRFEIRARIPAVNGAWPAIWTLGDWGEWPTNGEIDIMEYYDNSILANVAWGSNTRWNAIWDAVKIPISHFQSRDPDFANKYHVWVLDWTPEFIKIYLNGELLNTTETARTLNADGSNPFTSRNHYVLLNLALGGNNGGDPWSPNYPITYFVDYVRVYQLDPSYSNCFLPIDAANNLAPDPQCNAINPDGHGDRVRNRNPMRVFCGAFCGEITGGVYAQRIPWTPGKSYRVRAMVWPNGNDVVLGVNGLGDDRDVIQALTEPLQVWQQVDFVFAAPETANASGGVFLRGTAGSLIDNVEVYEVENSFLEVTRSQLHFNNTQWQQTFRVTAHQLTSNVMLTAPQGITLSRNTLTPAEAALGVLITATYDQQTTVNNQNINIVNFQFNRSIRVNASPRAVSQNLLTGWDAHGLTGANTEPNRMGWIANGTVTWRTANATADVRYADITHANNYTLNGEPWSGRVLHLRWDGGVTPGNVYAFPVELQAGRTYTLSGMFAWQANGSEHAVYSIGINSQSNNRGDMFTSFHRSIPRADRFKLFEMAQLFTVPTDGTYFVTFDNTGTIMGAVANLQVREGIFLPQELSVTPTNLIFNESGRTRTMALQGRFIRNDIQVVTPQGITVNRPVVRADDINSGTVVLTATFDGTRTFFNERIDFMSEGITRSLTANAVQFASSVITPMRKETQLHASISHNMLTIHFTLDAPGKVTFDLFSLKGELIASFSGLYDASEKSLTKPVFLSKGSYVLRMTTPNGISNTKIMSF